MDAEQAKRAYAEQLQERITIAGVCGGGGGGGGGVDSTLFSVMVLIRFYHV